VLSPSWFALRSSAGPAQPPRAPLRSVALRSLRPSLLKQRMRHLGQKAGQCVRPWPLLPQQRGGRGLKTALTLRPGAPRGPSTCHHLCNLQPTHLIEAPRYRSCSTQIAMPTRVYRPRPRWRASLSFAKPGGSSWLSLNPHCLDLGAAPGASKAFGWPRTPSPWSPNPRKARRKPPLPMSRNVNLGEG
jgi:hypothetical protein